MIIAFWEDEKTKRVYNSTWTKMDQRLNLKPMEFTLTRFGFKSVLMDVLIIDAGNYSMRFGQKLFTFKHFVEIIILKVTQKQITLVT